MTAQATTTTTSPIPAAHTPEHPVVYVFGKTPDINEHYHLGRQLGQPGQFGRAVLATHHETGQLFGCKIITKAKFVKSEQLAQFKQEIEIMKQLSHPHIIHFEQVFEDRNNIYIVMELCSGGEMFDRIQTYGKYSEVDASRLLRQITRALRHMHAHNIAHCDLKPDNFLLTTKEPDAPVKVIDFGLSKFVKHRQYFTRFCGTTYYMAPDVLRGRYNESADMWSLGVIMFVMLFGYPPFYADPAKYGKQADQRIYDLIRQGFDPTVKRGYGPWFPQALPISASAMDLISKLLTLDSAKRLTAEEALSHDWLKGDTASAIPLDPLVVKALKTFEYHCKFKNAVLELMIDQLSDDDIAKLRVSFKAMDEDGSGTVTLGELKKALVRIKKEAREAKEAAEIAAAQLAGLQITPQTLQQRQAGESSDHKEANDIAESIMRTVDVNGDGVISYQELMLTYVHRKLNNKEERLYAAFCKLDRDGNGRLTIDELESILTENGMLSSRSELEAMIKEVDVDGNGMIDYEEFLNMMWIQTNKEVEEVEDDLPERAKEEVQEIRRRSASNSPVATPRSHLSHLQVNTNTSANTIAHASAHLQQQAQAQQQQQQQQPQGTGSGAISPFITHQDIIDREKKMTTGATATVLPQAAAAAAAAQPKAATPVSVPVATATATKTPAPAPATTTTTAAPASNSTLQAPKDQKGRKNSNMMDDS